MRRIKKAKIKYISLVPRGANKLPVLYKDDGTFDIQMLTKETKDEGVIVGTVYAPEIRDSHGDIASAAVIKEAMYDAAKEGLSIDIRHNEKPVAKADAYIAESFIIQKDDPRFDGMQDRDGNNVDVSGGWGVVIKIDNPELREKYKKGEWNGISMGGTGVFEETSKQDEPLTQRSFMSFIKGLFTSNSGDIDMTKEEMAEALEKSNKSLVEGIAKIITPLLTPKKEDAGTEVPAKKEEPKKDDTPVFSGEMTKENLAKFQLEVKKHAIKKGINWSDPDSIQKAMEEIEKLEAGTASTATPPGSRQPASTEQQIDKEGDDLFKLGQEMAKIVNTQRGHN